MTDTCTRCGERESVPGEFGSRCIECVREIASERVANWPPEGEV